MSAPSSGGILAPPVERAARASSRRRAGSSAGSSSTAAASASTASAFWSCAMKFLAPAKDFCSPALAVRARFGGGGAGRASAAGERETPAAGEATVAAGPRFSSGDASRGTSRGAAPRELRRCLGTSIIARGVDGARARARARAPRPRAPPPTLANAARRRGVPRRVAVPRKSRGAGARARATGRGGRGRRDSRDLARPRVPSVGATRRGWRAGSARSEVSPRAEDDAHNSRQNRGRGGCPNEGFRDHDWPAPRKHSWRQRAPGAISISPEPSDRDGF